MPFENEHSCRLRNPDDFKKNSFRRTSRKHNGKEYGIISGRLKGEDTMTEQAYRYKKDTWSTSDARTHCKDHDGSFEAAKSEKSMPVDVEMRILNIDDIELRVTDGDEPKISGYAAKFGKWSLDLGGFKEKIRAGAFDEALEKCDVRALKNHDPNLLLGRTSSGTLELKTNSVGLRMEIDPPDTNTGRDTIEEIRRKDITGCSFSFITVEEDWKYPEDGIVERTIIKVGELFDVGPVTYPAYPDTTVAARSMDAHQKSIEQEKRNTEQEKQKSDEEIKLERERQREIDRKYRHAGRIINRNKPADV